MKLKLFLSLVLILSIIASFCSCNTSSLKCQSCGASCSNDMSFCPSCGEKIVLAANDLCSCGYKNQSGAKFCASCGNPLNQANNNSNNNNTLPEKTWLLLEEHVKSTGYTIKHFYDSNGYKVGQESWTNNGTLNTYNKYTNDSKGNCVESYSSISASLGFKATTAYTNTYDTKGRLTKAVSESGSYDQYYYDGNELVKVSHVNSRGEEYYDEYKNGKMVKSHRCDSTTGYQEITIKFYYDNSGRCTGTSHKDFSADEYGNITEDAFCTYEYISLDDYLAQNLQNNKYAQGGNSSNSGGSSGGSNQNSGSIDSTSKTCTACGGSGKGMECIGCDGKGKALSYYDINDKPVYRTCNGCQGRGYIKCAYCGGDGLR